MDKFIKLAILFAVTAVALGALVAHGLQDILSFSEIQSFKTGVRYQLLHSITLLVLSLNNDKFNYNLKKILLLMISGMCLFSFSIYLLCIKDLLTFSVSFLGPVTPIGGLLLITSWVLLFFNIKKQA